MRRGAPRQTLCIVCGKRSERDEMAGDHVVRWSKGSKTVLENCQMLCAFGNGSKSDREPQGA